MTDTRPGADELRVRGILRARGVGPAAAPPVPPKPTAPPRDWLDDILDSNTAGPAPTKAAPQPEPEGESTAAPAPRRPSAVRRVLRPKSGTGGGKTGRAAAPHPAVTDPRTSLVDALDAVPHRLRRLAANSTAAGLGWSLGLVDFTRDICAWVDLHGPADPQSIFWFVVGIACLALHHSGRGRWAPVAWLDSVPAASAVLGVLLYAPTT
ncbi:hypothetical protein ABZ369_22415 [Streptomyces sp. NPDC005918]|uniref:hypothetical protein n=1 Tax=Streptomyces sp. NPDC005918 TaxID=3155454 RepID=UPI003411C4C3